MLATIIPVVTPVRTGYRPDYYVSVYNGESDPLVFSVSDTDYDCANRINLRDSNIFTQYKLLEEALYYHLKKSEYWESCILVIGDYEFVVPEEIYSKTHIGDTTTLKYFYDNGRLLRVQFGDIDGYIEIHHDAVSAYSNYVPVCSRRLSVSSAWDMGNVVCWIRDWYSIHR